MLVKERRQLRISVPRRSKKWGSLINWFRRLGLFILNLLFNHQFMFRLVGYLNEKWNFLNTIFVAYPATERYALAYSYSWWRDRIRWTPWLCGIFHQNGKWGLMTAISSTEKDFYKLENHENLKNLVEVTDQMRLLLGASQKTFAGILPSVLSAKGLIDESIEAYVTVKAVMLAINEVRQNEEYPKDCPIIVLGGRGFIGSRLVQLLGSSAVCVDINPSEVEWPYRLFGQDDITASLAKKSALHGWPYHLYGKEAILVNLTKRSALAQYINLFWPELVVINEVYPEPSEKELAEISKIGCNAYHIVGVMAKSYPSLPKAYAGGVPCCAAWFSDKMEAVVQKLN